MRKDMGKLLVEAGRRKSLHRNADRYYLNREEREEGYSSALPSRESMKAPHIRGHNYPLLLDKLNPIYRWLEKQVGRPWDKVYSELVAGLKHMSAVHRVHVESHLQHTVDIHNDDRGKWADYEIKKGILVKRPPHKFTRPKPEVTEFIRDEVKYELYKGIWFKVVKTTEEVINPLLVHLSDDTHKYIKVQRERRYSLSKKELKQLGLKNDM